MTFLKKTFGSDDVELINTEVLYQGFFKMKKYQYRHRQYQGGWSPLIEREIFERGNAVGVLLYDPELDHFVMIEQCRPGSLKDKRSPWLLEIIAGMVEDGEDPHEVAYREAMEEAHVDINKLIAMLGYWVSPGGTTEYVDLFLGLVDSSNLVNYAGLDDEHEDIKVLAVSRQEMLQLLANGGISNAMALIAIQWFLLNEQQLDLADD
ncbi:MAG: NUDIX domain-containing protein [Kangiella sp.]|nr:NUDIX domain-containing protein [Kangiella sp.]MCW9029612.1 NUDIX domain-containing protein [Kangiella sp.]